MMRIRESLALSSKQRNSTEPSANYQTLGCHRLHRLLDRTLGKLKAADIAQDQALHQISQLIPKTYNALKPQRNAEKNISVSELESLYLINCRVGHLLKEIYRSDIIMKSQMLELQSDISMEASFAETLMHLENCIRTLHEENRELSVRIQAKELFVKELRAQDAKAVQMRGYLTSLLLNVKRPLRPSSS